MIVLHSIGQTLDVDDSLIELDGIGRVVIERQRR
jgi:hypothetical protein